MTRSETAFLAEMERREALPPLYEVPGYGVVRVNPSPCDPRQFLVKGIAVFILRMETEAKGKRWHGARFLTLETAKKNLERVAKKMRRAERMD